MCFYKKNKYVYKLVLFTVACNNVFTTYIIKVWLKTLLVGNKKIFEVSQFKKFDILKWTLFKNNYKNKFTKTSNGKIFRLK